MERLIKHTHQSLAAIFDTIEKVDELMPPRDRLTMEKYPLLSMLRQHRQANATANQTNNSSPSTAAEQLNHVTSPVGIRPGQVAVTSRQSSSVSLTLDSVLASRHHGLDELASATNEAVSPTQSIPSATSDPVTTGSYASEQLRRILGDQQQVLLRSSASSRYSHDYSDAGTDK